MSPAPTAAPPATSATTVVADGVVVIGSCDTDLGANLSKYRDAERVIVGSAPLLTTGSVHPGFKARIVMGKVGLKKHGEGRTDKKGEGSIYLDRPTRADNPLT